MNNLTDKKSEIVSSSNRRVIFIAIVIAAILLGGLTYYIFRERRRPTVVQSGLEGAIRSGSPEFEQFASRIILDEKDAFEADRPVGDVWMQLRATVRNFTGRTLDGLEVHGAILGPSGEIIKERTVVVLSNQQGRGALEPNETMPLQVTIEGINKQAFRVDYKLEVTAFRFRN